MRFSAVCIGVALALSASAPAWADVRIQYDPGGHIGAYYDRYQEIRRSGERVVIDGPCLSACTLVLGLVPRQRMCATNNAVFGFHAAWFTDGYSRSTSPSATRFLLDHYPVPVRSWIARRGGLTPKMLLMQGNDLNRVIAPCVT